MSTMQVANGFARKISLIFLGGSFVGWMIFTAGFGQFNAGYKEIDDDYNPGKESSLYALWAGSVMGPFVIFLAAAHAVLWGIPGSVVGSITAVLSIMYLSAVGYGMVAGGIYIKNDINSSFLPDEVDRGYRLLFAGGFITTLFLTVHLAFWPWFKAEDDRNNTPGKF